MGIFATLFSIIFSNKSTENLYDLGHAVTINFDISHIPESDFDKDDHELSRLEDQLIDVLMSSDVGEFSNDEFNVNNSNQKFAALYIYGPNAEVIFETIKPVLASHKLSQRARVSLRLGPKDTPEKTIQLFE